MTSDPARTKSSPADPDSVASVEPAPHRDPGLPEQPPGPERAIVELDEIQATLTVSNVRAAPTTEADKLATLRAGTIVRATGQLEDGSWVRIALSGHDAAWIWAELVAPVDPDERAAWRRASRGDAQAVARFLRQYPRGAYARVARARLAELEARGAGDASRGASKAYVAPGPDAQRSRAFLTEHRQDIETAIREHYRAHGTIWDEPSVSQQADHLYEFRSIELDAARSDAIDLLVRYRWEGDGIVADAAAKFRLRVTPDSLTVVKMWR